MKDVVDAVLAAVIGLILLVSALAKLRRPAGFLLIVLEYRMLPPAASRLYALMLPPAELLTALMLISGTEVRLASVAASLLLVSFVAGVGVNMARGRRLECGCFGRYSDRRIGTGLLTQDIAMLGGTVVILSLAHGWVFTEPWSIFRLFGLVPSTSLAPLLACVVLAALAAPLLSRLEHGRRTADVLMR